MPTARTIALLCCVLPLIACGPPPQGPFMDDQRYLTLGVDPSTETKALIADLESQGLHARPLLHGEHFYALGIQHPDLTSIGVRVITVRGIALALDRVKPMLFQEETRYRLLQPPWSDTHDADGDGFEELFVEVKHGSGKQTQVCIAIYRVRDSGDVEPVDGRGFELTPPNDGQFARVYRKPNFCALPSAEEPEPGPGNAPAGSPASSPAVMTAPTSP